MSPVELQNMKPKSTLHSAAAWKTAPRHGADNGGEAHTSPRSQACGMRRYVNRYDGRKAPDTLRENVPTAVKR
jgi:hypothetical protein